jgi:IS30 family transposase
MSGKRKLGVKVTQEQIDEVWRLRDEGLNYHRISLAVGINSSSTHYILKANGGFRQPVQKLRDGRLTFLEREEISRGIAVGKSYRLIAKGLGRSTSTVSREVGRCGGKERYRATYAHQQALLRQKRPKTCKLDDNRRLKKHVIAKLEDDWSPEQIAGDLKVSFPDDESMRLSHETIYKSLYIQSRGALKRELCAHLRTKRNVRKSQSNSSPKRSGSIKDGVSIRERPAEVDDRVVPGHWEGDLVFGTIDSQVATLVERTTLFVMLVKTETKEADHVSNEIGEHFLTLPEQLRKSLTWDLGSELAKHKKLAKMTNIDVYFCDPHSPWQRGINENTNGLLRQYLPKGKDMSHLTQEDFDAIALKLNTRPRKSLGFRTPAVMMEELLR